MFNKLSFIKIIIIIYINVFIFYLYFDAIFIWRLVFSVLAQEFRLPAQESSSTLEWMIFPSPNLKTTLDCHPLRPTELRLESDLSRQ
jgi:hypothetical protein